MAGTSPAMTKEALPLVILLLHLRDKAFVSDFIEQTRIDVIIRSSIGRELRQDVLGAFLGRLEIERPLLGEIVLGSLDRLLRRVLQLISQHLLGAPRIRQSRVV